MTVLEHIRPNDLAWESFHDPHGRPTTPTRILRTSEPFLIEADFPANFHAGLHWHPHDTSWISDDNIDNLQKLDSLKDSVTEALSDVINLTSKLTNTKKNLPDKLPNTPMELSFWIGAHLGGPVAEEQQRLLEERNTFTRLQREYEMLDHTRKQLAARTALKESFPDIKEN